MMRFRFAFIFCTLSCAAWAEVRLPKVFSSHMVLQRDRPIHIWGWSEPGEEVTATLNGASQVTHGDRIGSWSVYLSPVPAGGPFQLAVAGSNRITLEDVLIGDVWFASGQSNMEMPLKGFGGAQIKNGAEEIAQANHSNLRLLLVNRKASEVPLEDLPGNVSWTLCTPQTAANFSAAAYFFGREIAEREHVAVGLIDSTWGGTPGEAWTSLDAIAADASLMPVFAARAEMMKEQAHLPAELAAEKREDAEARSKHLPPATHPWRPDPASWAPAWLFNGMVAPFTPLATKGVIWYQGEANTGPERAFLYEKVFKTLITDWRNKWSEGDFPFLFVQISSFNADPPEDWPVVREAQRRALGLRNTSMAVTIDVGNPANVHPADKQAVGSRLALAARALAYGEDVEYSGPAYRETTTEPKAVRVWFDHANGLVLRGNAQEFEIAGEDQHFVRAEARVDGASVVLTNPQVPEPKYARYAWRNAPSAALFNAAGLPASPFTSVPPAARH